MLNLLIHLRLMHLLFHHYHNVVARVAFGADHELFNEWYNDLSEDYDSVAERLVGLTDSSQLNLHAILDGVSAKCKQYPQDAKENAILFQAGLQLESELKQQIDALIKTGGVSEGTKNLLAQIADDSESRVYKIKRRLVK